jgi:hypothetical protein
MMPRNMGRGKHLLEVEAARSSRKMLQEGGLM